jgi:hypothetical protein
MAWRGRIVDRGRPGEVCCEEEGCFLESGLRAYSAGGGKQKLEKVRNRSTSYALAETETCCAFCHFERALDDATAPPVDPHVSRIECVCLARCCRPITEDTTDFSKCCAYWCCSSTRIGTNKRLVPRERGFFFLLALCARGLSCPFIFASGFSPRRHARTGSTCRNSPRIIIRVFVYQLNQFKEQLYWMPVPLPFFSSKGHSRCAKCY